jgi:hypothetical protein
VLLQSHQQYHELLVGEENKRKALLDIIYNLEASAVPFFSQSLGSRQLIGLRTAAASLHQHCGYYALVHCSLPVLQFETTRPGTSGTWPFFRPSLVQSIPGYWGPAAATEGGSVSS